MLVDIFLIGVELCYVVSLKENFSFGNKRVFAGVDCC